MLLIDLTEATKSHTQLLVEAILEAVGDKKDMPLGWKNLQRYLSPKERDNMRRDVAQRMVDIFRRLPSDKEFEAAAIAGKAKKGWYAASAKALIEVFGADTPRFAALLASLSPQVSVVENLRNAIRFWEKWIAAGRPTNPKDVDEVGVSAVGEPRWLGTTNIDPVTKKPVHKAGMGWRKNVMRAITNPQPEKIILSSGGTETNPTLGKVDAFRANLMGDLSRVTNDAWMAHFANIDQTLFSSKAGYLAMTARIRKIAQKLNWEPAEVQETVWSFFKALKESQTPESKGREALLKLSHRDVNDSANFADLMAQDEEVRDALKRLRNRGLAGEVAQDIRDGGPDPTGSPYELGAQAGLAGSLGRIADRAESLKHREDLQELGTRGYTFTKAQDLRLTGTTATFVINDPRELKEFEEKKPEENYVLVGRRDGKWEVLYGASLVFSEDIPEGKRLRFKYAGSKTVKPAEIDPEKWRYVKQVNAKRALRIATQIQQPQELAMATEAEEDSQSAKVTIEAIAKRLLDHLLELRRFDRESNPKLFLWSQDGILKEVNEVAVKDAYMEEAQSIGRKFHGKVHSLDWTSQGFPSQARLERLTEKIRDIIRSRVQVEFKKELEERRAQKYVEIEKRMAAHGVPRGTAQEAPGDDSSQDLR